MIEIRDQFKYVLFTGNAHDRWVYAGKVNFNLHTKGGLAMDLWNERFSSHLIKFLSPFIA